MLKDLNYKQILDAMFEDLAIVDERGMMIYVGNEFGRKYNVKLEKVLGRSIDELEKENVFNPSVAKRVFSTGEKVIMSHKNGRGDYLIITGIPVLDEDGKIKYVVSYSVPGDEIKALQLENEHLLQQLGEYQQALDDLQQYIQKEKPELRGADGILESIHKIQQYDVSVLFTGESGVGKTTYARYLHENGQRAKGPFVEISCGAIPENLLESELFGYKSGSFTGASREGKLGLIETANHGTLFLDEIGELPLRLQSKLLKVLQEKKIMRVGDTKEIEVDFRLITATNQNLHKMVEEGTFREDLFYRINVITIEIPPIRERPDDCLALIQFFLGKCSRKYGVQRRIEKACLQQLCEYPWPGNIREIENTMERLVLMAESESIGIKDLPEQILYGDKFKHHDFDQRDGSLPELLKEYEGFLIKRAAKKYKTSVMVAKKLGISQPTAFRKMKEYMIEE